jgi:hypothetical protein
MHGVRSALASTLPGQHHITGTRGTTSVVRTSLHHAIEQGVSVLVFCYSRCVLLHYWNALEMKVMVTMIFSCNN